jgi:hypothetical protein
LPWGVLAAILVAFRPNHNPAAWWIWAPVAALTGFGWLTLSALGFVPAEATDFMGVAIQSMLFALAVVWLLWPLFAKCSRAASFFAVAGLLLVAASVFAALSSGLTTEPAYMLFVLVLAFNASLALGLSVVTTWNHFSAARWTLHLAAWLLGIWLVTTSPFLLIMLVANQDVPALPMLMSVLSIAAISWVLFQPFILLATLQPFYRQRLFSRPTPQPTAWAGAPIR